MEYALRKQTTIRRGYAVLWRITQHSQFDPGALYIRMCMLYIIAACRNLRQIYFEVGWHDRIGVILIIVISEISRCDLHPAMC